MKTIVCLTLALSALGRSYADPAGSKITDRQVSVVGFVDAGQIVQGSLIYGDGVPKEVDHLFLNRNGIALTYSGTLNGKLHTNIGVGGLFWKPVAADPATEGPQDKRIQFGPGISEASSQYDFSPRLNLKFGYFGYDYNPDAKNLGEYLLRSEAYPGIIHTAGPGGWVWMNESKYKSMGAKLTWESRNGNLRQDLLIFSEFWEGPFFDFSPSYVATLKVGNAVEVGAGVSLHRWIPIKPSQTTPNRSANTYVEVDNFPAFPARSDASNNPTQVGFAGGTVKGMENQIEGYVDSSGSPIATRSTDPAGKTIFILANGDTLYPKTETVLTFKAVKVMGRASLNISRLLNLSENTTGPFKIFGEVAVLGVENQPYFYEKIQNRIPVMVGVDIPTFGLLNLLSMQLEYFNNPYPDNNYQQTNQNLPQPAFPSGSEAQYEYNRQAGEYKDDDLKWSVFLEKSLYTGLDLYVQVANDHFRTQNYNAEPASMPVTRGKSDWYWLLRIQWSM